MTNKLLEETKAELAAISGKSYEQISSWDDLAKVIRLECVKAAEQVAKLEALHEQALSGSEHTLKSQGDILQEATKNTALNCSLIGKEQAPDFSGVPQRDEQSEWFDANMVSPDEDGIYNCRIINGGRQFEAKRKWLKVRWFGGCRPFSDNDQVIAWQYIA